MLHVLMLSVVILNVVTLSIDMLSVVAPCQNSLIEWLSLTISEV